MVGDTENEKVKEWAEAPKFREFLKKVLMVQFWGMGLFELKKGEWFDFYHIPIKHINPYKQEILKRQTDSTGVSYTKMLGKNMVFVGGKDDLGLFKTLTPLSIYKRMLRNNWATYTELAGNNFQAVKYRGNVDPKRRAELQAALQSAKMGRAFQIPDGIDMEVTNLSSSSQNQLFENYAKYIDTSQAKLVLGQTMTTADGSSRSQAEVHERTPAEIFASDYRYILNFLNYEFYDFHRLYGLPTEGRWGFKEDSSVKELKEIEKDLKLKSLGYTFTPEQIAEKYGLEKPQVQEEQVEETEESEEPTKEEENDNSDNKGQRKAKAVPGKD
jgi:phage gp29-like protein